MKDAWSRRIVGYAIDDRMTSHMTVDALRMAVARRGGPQVTAGRVVPSDRGSQFRSRKLVHQLHRHGMVGWMGRVGAWGLTLTYHSRCRQRPLGKLTPNEFETIYATGNTTPTVSTRPSAVLHK